MSAKHFGFIGFGLIGGSIARALKTLLKETTILTAFQYSEKPSRSLTLAKEDANLSLALGSLTYGVSPAKLCAAYCTLGNGGMRVQPHCITRIVSPDGFTLYARKDDLSRAVSKTTAYTVTDMLKTAAATGATVTRRVERGAKSAAACGQLRVNAEAKRKDKK